MSDRRWRTAGDSERRRMVDETRPEGTGGRDLVVAPEPIDLSELVRGVPSFDDLRDVSLESGRLAEPEVAVADLEALELASSTAGASPIGVELGSVEPGTPSTTAADDETAAMVDPNVADPAAPEVDAANDTAAAAGTSADGVAGTDDHASDGATDATIAQPRPIDLGHPVGRD
jgi:hypothetical protein